MFYHFQQGDQRPVASSSAARKHLNRRSSPTIMISIVVSERSFAEMDELRRAIVLDEVGNGLELSMLWRNLHDLYRTFSAPSQ